VVGCSQSEDAVEVEVQRADGSRERLQRSLSDRRRRRAQHGARTAGIAFEGFTYPERFMIIGSTYDFSRAGYAYRNYISEFPVEWYNLFKISWKARRESTGWWCP